MKPSVSIRYDGWCSHQTLNRMPYKLGIELYDSVILLHHSPQLSLTTPFCGLTSLVVNKSMDF